jgi:hypothetical protein
MAEEKHISKVNTVSPLTVGIIIMFISLVVFGGFLFVRTRNSQESQIDNAPTATLNQDADQSKVMWQEFTNDKYGFTVARPPLLIKRETENEGGYLYFVRFEENQYSLGKGVAIGVGENTRDEEVNNIKKSIKDEAGIDPDSEEEIIVSDQDAIKLTYHDNGQYESRAFVVFEKNGKTFSISTVPEQMNRVVESFEFN